MLRAFVMLRLTLSSFKVLKKVYTSFFPSPSISKKMSGSKKRLPSSKLNVMVSFKMIHDNFNFSV